MWEYFLIQFFKSKHTLARPHRPPSPLLSTDKIIPGVTMLLLIHPPPTPPRSADKIIV